MAFRLLSLTLVVASWVVSTEAYGIPSVTSSRRTSDSSAVCAAKPEFPKWESACSMFGEEQCQEASMFCMRPPSRAPAKPRDGRPLYGDGSMCQDVDGTWILCTDNPCQKAKANGGHWEAGLHDFTITSIGDRAFYECSGLTSADIPSSVTSIGKYAFHRCSNLTSVDISPGPTSIGDYAFQATRSLTDVEIPSSVTSIGWGAFYGAGNGAASGCLVCGRYECEWTEEHWRADLGCEPGTPACKLAEGQPEGIAPACRATDGADACAKLAPVCTFE